MRVTANYDIYSRNIQYKYNNPSNPFFTSGMDEEKPNKMSNKKKWTIASLGTAVLGALGIKTMSKKPPKVPATEIKPVVETAVDVVGNLIRKLKPKNEELAREFFPVLEHNSQTLKLKQEDYNTILSGIHKHNRKYMKDEGFGVITSQMGKMEDLIASPADDILTLVRILTKENQDIFTRIVGDRETFRLVDISDIATYLKHITPENKDYVFNELVPLLERYAKELKIKTAEKHAKLLSQITPETQDVIPTVAESKVLDSQRISKYQVLLGVNKDNKDCVAPLIDNVETLGLNQNNTVSLLNSLHNEQAGVIGVVGKNIDRVNDMGLNIEKLFTVLKDDKGAQIFDTVIANPQGYKINELIDLKNYVRNLDPKNLEFVDKTLLPKLLEHSEVLGIRYAEEMAEVMGKLTPKTAGSIDTVAGYAQKLGDGVSYPALLQAVTEENQGNLPRLMENIKNTEVWDNFMVGPEDFAKLLAGG